MGNASSSSYGSSVPVLPTPDDYDWSGLRELYNSHVYSAKIKQINFLGSLGPALDFGLYITTTNGRSYLIHSTNASGDQVITEARHMSSDWKDFNSVIINSPKNNPTIGDLMASARKDGKLKLLPSAQQIKQSVKNELPSSPEKHGSLAIQNKVKEAEIIMKKMKERGIEPDIHTYEQLINVYASVGNIEKSLSTFDMIDYTYVNNLRTDDAFNVYSKMKAAKILPNQPIFSMLIKVCIKNGEIPRAWKTFDHMRLEVCQPDETRDAERAFDLYQEMKDKGLSPTDVTFNSLIDACAHQAFRLLNEMEDYGYTPDLFTYNSLLYACSHKVDFYTARKLFILMMQNGLKDQSLAPDDTTFTNLFWVYGQLQEVLDHYKDTIPKYNIELDGWIFLTLLNACYRHKKVEFAWSIWQDWQIWWKLKKQDLVIIQKLNNHDQRNEFKRLGLTKNLEYDTYKLMINILARCEDIWGAIRLLQKLSQTQIPKFEHFQLLRLKCLEKENELALTKLMELSYFDEGTPGTKVKELLAKKWKGINVLPGKVGRKVLQMKLKNDDSNKFKGKIDWKKFKEGKNENEYLRNNTTSFLSAKFLCSNFIKQEDNNERLNTTGPNNEGESV
ncbi:3972_t:CDS:10 [Diversispora eburnea]|uniref:3972_t:CDS:1 n=1 Tax=Diversispora eburnea TaxID=1213867 RepID=A0A9N8VWR7_9GLOM|nr:3972_t:CDS:10 [Diversispora eburnea]